MLPVFAPPPSLIGRVGGSGVPNLRRVAPVDSVPPYVDAPAAAAHATVAPVGGAPLPPGGISVYGAGGSP